MINIIENKGQLLISFEKISRFDTSNAHIIQNNILSHFKKNNYSILFDLQNINFIDSKGFSTLIYLKNFLKKRRKTLKVYNLNSDVKELFELMNLTVLER